MGRARDESEHITGELAAAYGLGGRPRRTGDPAERWRKAVSNQIRRSLGLHLRNAVHTGRGCAYTPDRPAPWSCEPPL